MFDTEFLIERLTTILKALERIPRRCAGISSPSDFLATEESVDRMDAICMILIAVGEELKSLDRKTEGKLFSRYPEVKWRGAMGVRDVLAHNYFQVNVEQLFAICREDIPQLIRTVRRMIEDIRGSRSDLAE